MPLTAPAWQVPWIAERAAIAVRDLGDPEHGSVDALIANLTTSTDVKLLVSERSYTYSVGILLTPSKRKLTPWLQQEHERWLYLPDQIPGGFLTEKSRNKSTVRTPSYHITGYQSEVTKDVQVRGYRTAVLDALIGITGKDFGADDDAWREWRARESRNRKDTPQPPASQSK